jgi:hypothetical protein
VWWNKEHVAVDCIETCHAAYITLIISSSVKQILKLNIL